MNEETSEIFDLKRLREYLSDLYRSEIELKYFGELGKGKETLNELGMAAKGFGYGKPYLIEFEAKGKHVSAVLETMRSNIFGIRLNSTEEEPGNFLVMENASWG